MTKRARTRGGLPVLPRHGIVGFCLCLGLGLPGALIGGDVEMPVPLHASVPTIPLDSVIDDNLIRLRLTEEGTHLIKSGRTVPMTTFISQLQRESCELDLPGTERVQYRAELLAVRSKAASVIVGRMLRGVEPNSWTVVPASGFFISKAGAFVTSRHVMNSPEYETVVAMTGDGRVLPVLEVLAGDAERDVVILRVDSGPVPALPIDLAAPAGTRVWVMSHPCGRFYTFTEGTVCRRSTLRDGSSAHEIMDISAEFGPGSSGAPVLNENGSAVGWVDGLRVRPGGVRDDGAPFPTLTFRECGVASDVLRLVRKPVLESK